MSVATSTLQQTNPFPGLRPFREEEQYLFFGRDNQVDVMVDKLADTRFLAVVGTSGSGKSSLVNCGLRPALHRGVMAGAGPAWRMAQFRPGAEPIREMARALAKDGVLFRDFAASGLPLAEIIETSLRMSKMGLIDIYRQAALEQDVNLLVVVDQFEELFRYRPLEAAGRGDAQVVGDEATAFVNLLLEVKQWAHLPIFVVLTMRSDFLGDCTQFPGLAESINTGQYLVPRMTRGDRRAAIVGPVGVGGAEIASVLVTRLVNDVGDNPDQLSILQHALNRTWARWLHEGGGDGPLDLEHYAAIGTMDHALDQHAEKAYAELGDTRQRKICERLFKALTDKATDPRGQRRPTKLATLCTLANATAAEVTEVIDVFREPSRSFLMPPAGQVLEPETIVDISHESLMRVWQRLIRWADEEARSARRYRRLADTAALHASGHASLWRDPELQLTLDWRDQNQPNQAWASLYDPGFAAAMSFLTQSSEARDAERAEREQQRRRELEAQQEKAKAQARYTRRMRWAALFSGALAVVAVVAFIVAMVARDRAEKARVEAQDAMLHAVAGFWVERDPTRAGLVLLEIQNPDDERYAERMRRVLSLPIAKAVLSGHQGKVNHAEFRPDGRRVVTASEDHTARVWLADGSGASVELKGHTDAVNHAEFSPDGLRVVTASDDKTARVWWLDGSRETVVLGDPDGGADGSKGHTDAVNYAEFSPDGLRVVTASDDRTARLWSAADGTKQAVLSGHDSAVNHAEFSKKGDLVVTASDDKTARLWSAAEGTEPVVLSGHSAWVRHAEFSVDGQVVTASDDGTARLWSQPDDGRARRWSAALLFHDGPVMHAEFSVDGRVVTASDDETARVWLADGSGEPVVLYGHGRLVKHATFSPDGNHVLTASYDNTARVWLVKDRKELVVLRGHENAVNHAEFSPDGLQVVTASSDGTARVWSAYGSGEPASYDQMGGEELQNKIRNATTSCLDTDFREKYLGQSKSEADKRFKDCENSYGR